MIWKRLKKVTPEQEKEFSERMEGVPFLDKVIMVVTAFFVIIVPCLLVMWILGML